MLALANNYQKNIRCRTHKRLGYVYFCDNAHPLASPNGFVYYHRHVASLKIGRWLTASEVVHHIDENKANNAPENLEVLTKKEHTQRHCKGKRGTRTCPSCKETFTLSLTSKRVQKYCSRACMTQKGVGRKFDPTKKELHELVWSAPTSHVAKLFGVSDVAIAKRCKRLGITKPPRGYWAKAEHRAN